MTLKGDAKIKGKRTCGLKKSTRELCVITLKNDAKFEELTCDLKNDMGNLVNFDPTLKRLKI